MQSEYEKGRQEVIGDIEKSINRQLKFLDGIKDQVENIAFSQEYRKGVVFGYEHIMGLLAILKDAEASKDRIATTNEQ
jgi:hypothetical protein